MDEQELLTDILWFFNIRLGGKWAAHSPVYEKLAEYKEQLQAGLKTENEQLKLKIKQLQEALIEETIIHRYQCPITRIGRTVSGPCDCNAEEKARELVMSGKYFE